ncbi:hypothetical protein CEUSTIGMA_g1618.t1 [Chlamydomonas eustigma]|uniref:Uncharacterized protein n=1 Tax=Chlamydomonas eustigma TaxID=1157962 RepID=A0A250WTW0_9CHLO|nr:hypothetical protein CEUSTIGMA_g1618.t1 [Chlamydomonas eustigma]|eukprot:GAX74169.1 hypothetical protein CEUSTIGMA_g1618.t1 [Chlamydomonas eustigma]
MQATAGASVSPLKLSSENWDSNFLHCLDLLKGPNDETRFVGLLLVTKLLQGGEHDGAIKDVIGALGSTFLNRLLLPLTRQRQDLQSPLTEDLYQQEILSCGLALAILSRASRLPDVAAGEDMMERVPALVKVVKAGGVSSLITRPTSGAAGYESQASSDSAPLSATATVGDALECLVNIATSGPKMGAGATTALLAGGLEAATKALAAAVGSGTAGLGLSGSVSSRKLDVSTLQTGVKGQGHAEVAGAGSSREDEGVLAQQEQRRVAMLAVRLVAVLLQFGGHSRLQTLSDQADVLQHTVVALGSLIGHPSMMAQLQEVPSSATPSEPQGQEDAAMLQLEALHALLLILPLPQELELHQRLSSGMHRQEWPASVRRGLNWLLRSRVSAVQKHSALQLAAALVEMSGPAWLLARGEQLPEAFLQVLAETLHVETALLLHDALYPDQLVPEDAGRSESRQQWQAPRATQAFMKAMQEQAQVRQAQAAEKVAEAMAAAKIGEAPSTVPPLPSLKDEMEGEPTEPTYTGTHHTQQHTQRAGERAMRLLPCCYLLLESVIEVLAEDFAMQDDEMMVIDEAGESEEDEEYDSSFSASRPTAPQRQGQQLLQPGVSQKAAQQLMYSLESTVAVVLQFMDELQEQGGGTGTVGSGVVTGRWSSVQADLALGAVRLLGRFLAEAPDSHTDAFRQALPFMLRVGSASPSSSSLVSFIPTGVTAAGPVQFLLPGLLLATSESSTASTQLKRSICKSPAALTAVASFLEAAAEEAVQLAEHLGPAATTSTASPFSAEISGSARVLAPPSLFARTSSISRNLPAGRALRMAELTRVERLMADASALLLNVVDAKDLKSVVSRRNSGSYARTGSNSGNLDSAASEGLVISVSQNLQQQQQQQQQPGLEQLGPVTRILLPAVSALGKWWRARSGWSASEAELTVPQQHVDHLAHARLMPRTILCCATLCGMVMEAAVKQAALLTAAAAGSASLQQQLDLRQGLGPISPEDVQPVCDLVLQALQAGCCISLTMMTEEEDMAEELAMRNARATVSAAAAAFTTGSSGSSRSGSGSTTPPSPRSPMHDPMMMAPASSLLGSLLGGGSGGGGGKRASRRQSTGGGPDTSMIVDDFPGDAEHAWERLGQSSVGLVELLQPMTSSALAAGWAQELMEAAAAVGGVQAMEVQAAKKRGGSQLQEGSSAASAVARQQELLLQAVGLRLLLSTLEAQGRVS